MLAIALSLLLHIGNALGQAFQTRCRFLLALVTLLLVLVHRPEQAFEMALQYVLEAVQVGRALHAALQAIDLFADLRVQLAGRGATIGVAIAGNLQVPLECF